jgi:hypothetical protein
MVIAFSTTISTTEEQHMNAPSMVSATDQNLINEAPRNRGLMLKAKPEKIKLNP